MRLLTRMNQWNKIFALILFMSLTIDSIYGVTKMILERKLETENSSTATIEALDVDLQGTSTNTTGTYDFPLGLYRFKSVYNLRTSASADSDANKDGKSTKGMLAQVVEVTDKGYTFASGETHPWVKILYTKNGTDKTAYVVSKALGEIKVKLNVKKHNNGNSITAFTYKSGTLQYNICAKTDLSSGDCPEGSASPGQTDSSFKATSGNSSFDLNISEYFKDNTEAYKASKVYFAIEVFYSNGNKRQAFSMLNNNSRWTSALNERTVYYNTSNKKWSFSTPTAPPVVTTTDNGDETPAPYFELTVKMLTNDIESLYSYNDSDEPYTLCIKTNSTDDECSVSHIGSSNYIKPNGTGKYKFDLAKMATAASVTSLSYFYFAMEVDRAWSPIEDEINYKVVKDLDGKWKLDKRVNTVYYDRDNDEFYDKTSGNTNPDPNNGNNTSGKGFFVIVNVSESLNVRKTPSTSGVAHTTKIPKSTMVEVTEIKDEIYKNSAGEESPWVRIKYSGNGCLSASVYCYVPQAFLGNINLTVNLKKYDSSKSTITVSDFKYTGDTLQYHICLVTSAGNTDCPGSSAPGKLGNSINAQGSSKASFLLKLSSYLMSVSNAHTLTELFFATEVIYSTGNTKKNFKLILDNGQWKIDKGSNAAYYDTKLRNWTLNNPNGDEWSNSDKPLNKGAKVFDVTVDSEGFADPDDLFGYIGYGDSKPHSQCSSTNRGKTYSQATINQTFKDCMENGTAGQMLGLFEDDSVKTALEAVESTNPAAKKLLAIINATAGMTDDEKMYHSWYNFADQSCVFQTWYFLVSLYKKAGKTAKGFENGVPTTYPAFFLHAILQNTLQPASTGGMVVVKQGNMDWAKYRTNMSGQPQIYSGDKKLKDVASSYKFAAMRVYNSHTSLGYRFKVKGSCSKSNDFGKYQVKDVCENKGGVWTANTDNTIKWAMMDHSNGSKQGILVEDLTSRLTTYNLVCITGDAEGTVCSPAK